MLHSHSHPVNELLSNLVAALSHAKTRLFNSHRLADVQHTPQDVDLAFCNAYAVGQGGYRAFRGVSLARQGGSLRSTTSVSHFATSCFPPHDLSLAPYNFYTFPLT
jgi:hypothetical protein